MIKIMSDVFDETTLNNGTVVMMLGTKWCPSCSTVRGNLQEFSDEHPEVTVAEIDIDENQRFVLNRFAVQQIPIVLTYQEGQMTGYFVGGKNKRQLERLFNLIDETGE